MIHKKGIDVNSADELRELSDRWWEFNRLKLTSSGDILHVPIDVDADFLPDEDETYVAVATLAANLSTLGPLLIALTQTAPTDQDIKYIGTTILENAHHLLGEPALELFSSLDLPERDRDLILSGFRPWPPSSAP
jgi:hypothetical protein